jgi:hypothetical protein
VIKKLWFAAVLSTLAAIIIAINVYSVDPSLWTTAGVGTKTLIQHNINESASDKFCNVHTEYEIEYSTQLGVRKFSKLIPVDACWYVTSYGLIGYNAPYSRVYVKVSNQSNAVVRLTDNTYGVSLGKTNAMAFMYYMNSYSRMLYIYDDIASRLTLSKAGSYDQYALDRSSNPWKLQYSNGSLVGVNVVYPSQNGEWLAVEGGGGFLRLNVKTKEILTFETSMYGYGYGANPTHELAISDDGRYAIIGGGPLNTKVSFIYDLSTCVPNTNKFIVATGCGKRNFKADYFSELPTDRGPFMYLFGSDNESITTNALNSTGTVDKYTITAAGKNQHHIEYLALGDSYSSGEGEIVGSKFYLPGTDGDGQYINDWSPGIDNFPFSSEKCHLSTNSYPYLLAKKTTVYPLGFKSIACSGSTINDIQNTYTTSNIKITYNGKFEQFKDYTDIDAIKNAKRSAISNFIPGRAAQIEFIERYKPTVVTMGIGGNDIKFSDKLVACLLPGTCSYENDLRYAFGVEIQTLHGELLKFYKRLSDAGPTTRFYVVGYPQIASTNEACAINVRLNFDERVMARNVISYLNEVIKSAAEYSGFTYLDVENSLVGKQLCEESDSELAVQGLVGGDDQHIVYELGGVRFYIELGNESFHPTHIGHDRITNQINAQLGGQSVLDFRKCTIADGLRCPNGNKASPVIPSYFAQKALSTSEYAVHATAVDTQYRINNQVGATKGASIVLQQPVTGLQEQMKLAPNQSVSVTMYSSPQNVGSMLVDSSGAVTGSISIPTDAEPGPHTIVINAKDSLYRDMTMYQQIFVYDSLDDFDGDGLLNEDEKCGLVEPINQDQDRDGIDDACDGIISEPPDTTAPVVTPHVTIQPNVNGWYNDGVTIEWSVSDNKDTDIIAPVSTKASLEGQHTYTSPEVCDATGNCAKGSISLKIDTIAPDLSGLFFSKNPKAVSEYSDLSAEWMDASSGVAEAEYFIADDPGVGNGATMAIDDRIVTTKFGTDFGTGVYKVSARVKDKADNWSTIQSDYLVVYDATSGVRFRGARTLAVDGTENQLPWITMPSLSQGKFAFSVRYGDDGQVTRQSDFQFAYKSGENCHKAVLAKDCHNFELNATRIAWLTTGGTNQSYGVFRGEGVLAMDGQKQDVTFIVNGVDGERLSPIDLDMFSLTIYRPTNEPLYFVAPTLLERGDIKIRF